MIPENKIEVVNSALKSVFGTNEIDDISQITMGLSSALVFRIIVKEKPYLLRIITRTDPMADPTHNYASMQKAADIGIAPKVWHMNVEQRFSITDFIQAKPFSIDEARKKLPFVLKKLHSLQGFPVSKVIPAFNMADTFIKKFKDLNLMPESETKEIFKQYEKISEIYPKDKDTFVSCHNDLKPENIVYDGDKPWLVDWESAFLNYRYADLSILNNFLNKNIEQEKEFLELYLEAEPTEYDLACFYLMQQVVHINYVTVFCVVLAAKGEAFDWKNNLSYDYNSFHDGMWKGEITLEKDEPKLHYALLHKMKLQENISSERFKDALKLVAKTN